MSKVSILSLEWDHQIVAIFKCFRTDEKCVADELKVAAGAEIKSDPDMHRVINALQRDLVHKRIYYYAKNPTTHLLTFREPHDGQENAGQQHLNALLQAQTTEQVRDQARALASRYTEIPDVREGVLIFLISRGTLGESVAENCAFIFKCDFEQVSQITSHQLFRQVQDAIVERTKKGALYPYFQQNEFDKTTVRVFDELGQTQYWLEFLGLGERAPAHGSLQEAVVSQLPDPIVAKYEGQFARLPAMRPLTDDRGRLISRADRLSTAKVQALSDEAIGEAGRQTVSLHLDQVRLTAPLNQYGRTWIIAEEAGQRYVIVKGSQLESHTRMLTPIDLADFPSLEKAVAELGISPWGYPVAWDERSRSLRTAISLDPPSNPILRLYSLFDQPGVVPHDDPHYLGLTISPVSDFGHERARELLEFLSRAAAPALRSCRLTLDGQPVVNFAAHPVTDLLDWPLIVDLAQQGVLSEDGYTVLQEWQQLLEQYRVDGYWEGDRDPVTDCPALLDDLKGCDTAGQPFALEVNLDKEGLAEQYLLGGLPRLREKVSPLVWFDLGSMRRAFGDFHSFIQYLAQAARWPVLLFFYQPTAPYPGDFFKVLSLHATPDTVAEREAAMKQQVESVTPTLLAEYTQLRTGHEAESRPKVGQRLDLPPALFLRLGGHVPSYPIHPLFSEGPARSSLVYALMAWLAERTEQRNGTTCFTLPSSGEVTLGFSLDDVTQAGASVFEGAAHWQQILPPLIHDLQRSAGRKPLRALWTQALAAQVAGDFTAARFFDTLKAVHQRFLRLEKEPLQISGEQPDLEIRIFFKKENTGGQIEFELNSQRLRFFHEPAGYQPIGKDDPESRVGDLSQMARYYLDPTRLVPDKPTPNAVLPDVGKLESQGQELWATLIHERLQKHYVRFREEDDLAILVVSDDASFPWELVKPYAKKGSLTPEWFEDPYWAMQFNLARWLAGHRPPANEIGLERVCCVSAGSALPGAIREMRFFKSLGVELAQPQTKAELLDLLSSNGYDVIHFSCHGQFDRGRPGESVVRLPDGSPLRPNELFKPRLEEMIGQSRPLVFLNVCHSGRTGVTMTGLGGWAERFIGMECGAFIGCGWEVSDPLAAEFAMAFYEGFRGGKPLGQAVRSARQRVKDTAAANSTWLAYYLYGNPYCRLKRAP